MEPQTVILIVLVGYVNALFVLGGVALGGMLVYRTKREPHEGLFTTPAKPSSAVAADEEEAPAGIDPFSGQDDPEEMSFGMDVMGQNKRAVEILNTEHPTFVPRDSNPGDREDQESS